MGNSLLDTEPVAEDDDDFDPMMRKARCSVFFKLVSSKNSQGDEVLEDVIATHSTWEGYSYMNRVYKYYSLPSLKDDTVGQRKSI
jgi:Phospholipase B